MWVDHITMYLCMLKNRSHNAEKMWKKFGLTSLWCILFLYIFSVSSRIPKSADENAQVSQQIQVIAVNECFASWLLNPIIDWWIYI